MPSRLRLSVVIPAWNEAPLIADAIRNANLIGDEVIVVDADSPDGTGNLAARERATVIQAPKGRGPQLRAGAAAQGDVFLFLHADARLPATARTAILDQLEDSAVVGGGFYIRFLPQSWFTRILEPSNDLRRRITKAYYGDTGIFIRKSVYQELGGHRPSPVMHDFEFSRRMEQVGRCVYIRTPCIWASARRFRAREIRTLFTWLLIQSLYRLGVSPHLLGRLYPDVRASDNDLFLSEVRKQTGFG
jgi:rSAM/selenodomain-associated transferase 2